MDRMGDRQWISTGIRITAQGHHTAIIGKTENADRQCLFRPGLRVEVQIAVRDESNTGKIYDSS